ncbi:gamma-glutamyl-gamma-aminobutyrate hydrolase [Bradyrhizobium sacchari]|uniref:gamma-glutamyl-gamma-aminobutyrate hydrolase n=1 Tax=Bradyrhizobium sacchari TaxID=1399419 RepID=A0A560JA76_9BRAD|nr:gamma-glutamyl-gamma-aminobutyrate hydrolase family protein [Bradyrhizobium sacchari]OPY95451.1 gamma-glutamyl-gamma-aminobutyrate hydrolase [Bradyrhizobium sacchari]TWB48746.1 gamma-glutamyl-gamma-aminobutyrate hydrolase [Bradyrhizobium sacchari]TWB67907.1 gamma-glutamyl-gamma-aminobutyrate hydrolase [Bradyrhizobium sacchari]
MTLQQSVPARAVVGVTSNRLLVDGVHRDWLRRKYVQALQRHAGVACVILPTVDAEDAREEVAPAIMGRLDGLVLTGDESNIDPAVLIAPASLTGPDRQDVEAAILDRPRDRLSAVAIESAIALGMPILGICRGLQELNVYFGGTLRPSLAEWSHESGAMHAEKPDRPRDRQYDAAHSVRISSDGALFPIAGTVEAQVNSLHNQGIEALASALRREAWAPDGLVEAASVVGAPTLQIGVQWHPEWHVSTDPLSKQLFKAFGEACVRYCRTKK